GFQRVHLDFKYLTVDLLEGDSKLDRSLRSSIGRLKRGEQRVRFLALLIQSEHFQGGRRFDDAFEVFWEGFDAMTKFNPLPHPAGNLRYTVDWKVPERPVVGTVVSQHEFI